MRKTRIIFREEDIMCETCEGHGTVIEKEKFSFLRSTCPKCGGVGKLDWITNAMGFQEEEEVRVSSSSVSRTSSSHSHTTPNHTHNYPNVTGNNPYISGINPSSLGHLPNLSSGGSNGKSLIIESDSLEIDCNHLILNEDMLDSLVNKIEQKLKEKEE